MSRKMISTFTAAVISMSISFAVPVAVTAVSSVTVVSEAQAFGWKSVKKRAIKTDRGFEPNHEPIKDEFFRLKEGLRRGSIESRDIVLKKRDIVLRK